MQIEVFDILLLFILALALALIIGINVVNIVDKRLSDIQIDVPACPPPVCPQPVCPKFVCPHSESYYHEPSVIKPIKHTNQIIKQKQIIKPIKSETKTIEKFEGTVSKSDEDGNDAQYLGANQTVLPMVITQDSTPVTRKTVLLRQGYNSTGADKPNTGDAITYPADADIVRYRGPGCFQNTDTKSIRKLGFDEINDKTCRPYTDSSVKEKSYNKLNVGFMTPSSDEPDRIVHQDIRFYVPRVYMGIDPYIAGVSYAGMSLEIPADIDQIGSIAVNDYDAEPVPIGSFMSD